MIKTKKLFFSFLILVFILLFSFQVTAYGLAPAKKIINFQPNLEQTIEFSVLSKGDSQAFFTLKLEGSLKDYAILEQESLYLDFQDTSKTFKVKLNLPDKLPPGENTLEVQVIEQKVTSESTAVVQTAIVGQVVVNVPYTGVHVESKLYIPKAKISQPLTFTISLFGRGDIPATCYATIDIKTPTNELVETLISEKIVVNKADAKKLELIYTNTQNKGLYLAEAIIHCQDKTNILRENFYIGDPSVSVVSIISDKFILGEIAPIKIALRNNWNQRFKDTYVEILVLGPSGTIIQQFKSASEEIASEEIKTFTAYWETEKITVGNYNLNVVTYFDNNGVNQEKFIANVQPNKLTVTKLTGQVVDNTNYESEDHTSKLMFLIIIITILIAVNIAVIVYFKTKKK